MKVIVYEDEAGEYRWKLVSGSDVIADSAEGYRHKGYAITFGEKPNPSAELVIDNKPEG